jgi:hypothetical protein
MSVAPARMLLIALAALVGVAAWRQFDRPERLPPDVLADRALHGPSAAQQTAAIRDLGGGDAASLAALRRVLRETTQPDVQRACIQSLAQNWDYESMDSLLELAESGPPSLRGAAVQAVMRMTGRRRPYSSAASAADRLLLVQHMRADWREIQRASPEDRAELKRRLRESHERTQ